MPLYTVKALVTSVQEYEGEFETFPTVEDFEVGVGKDEEPEIVLLSVIAVGEGPKPVKKPAKPRRKRRTKAEIAAAKAAGTPGNSEPD